MKRYLLFYGQHHYPSGGANDLRGSFNVLEEAKEAYKNHLKDSHYTNDDLWCNILDTETGKKITIK